MARDELLSRIGARIRELRRARGWSMEHLAELADLDATYLGQIERGQGNATVRVLGQLSTALGVELDGLVGPNATASEAALRRAVGKKIRGMNMNELRVLARILEAIG